MAREAAAAGAHGLGDVARIYRAWGRHPRLYAAQDLPTTGWNPDRDLVADMDQVFGNVAVETFNAGSLFVAWAQKREIEP